MIIDIKDILFLDDNNEYVVISKINYNDKNYYYLLDKNNLSNIKFCYEDNEEFVEIDDKKLITKLLPFFLEKTQKELENKDNKNN